MGAWSQCRIKRSRQFNLWLLWMLSRLRASSFIWVVLWRVSQSYHCKSVLHTRYVQCLSSGRIPCLHGRPSGWVPWLLYERIISLSKCKFNNETETLMRSVVDFNRYITGLRRPAETVKHVFCTYQLHSLLVIISFVSWFNFLISPK